MHPSTTHLAGRTALQLLAVLAMLAALLAPMLIGSAAQAAHDEDDGIILTPYTEENGFTHPGDFYTGPASVFQVTVGQDAQGASNNACENIEHDAVGEIRFEGSDLAVGKSLSDDSEDPSITIKLTDITITEDGYFFDYEVAEGSVVGVTSVYVKQATDGMFYEYSSPSMGDANLHPQEYEGQIETAVSHISFCLAEIPTVETYTVTLNKVDGSNDDAPMANVGFTLYYDDEGSKGEAVGDEQFTDDTGTTNWADLEAGTYWLEETTVPAGYDPMSPNPLEVTVDGDVTIDVANTLTPVVSNPAISLEKTAVTSDGLETDDGTPLVLFDSDDETVTYTFVVMNTGDVTLTDVVIDDPMLSDGVIPVADSLAAGESETVDVVYTVTEADLEAGTLTNLATAIGNDGDDEVTDEDDALVEIAAVEDVVIEKPDPKPAPDVESEELAQTGLDAPWLAVLSALFLALGTALLRRTAPLTRTVRRFGS